MDFVSVSSLNVRVNTVSGNLLPLTPDDSSFPITLRMYGAFVWLLEVILICAIVPGSMAVSWEQVVRDSTVTYVLLIEVLFIYTRFYTCRKILSQLIQKLNDILSVADNIMKNIVTTTLKPIQAPLAIYVLSGTISVGIYCCVPFLLIREKNVFFYEDYKVPAIFSKQPFSTRIFLFSSIFLVFSLMYVFVKKGGLDIYTIHLVLIMTAQYRYISTRLAIIFREGNPQIKFDDCRQEYCYGIDRLVEKEIKALCRHQSDVIRLSSLLKEVLSLNCSMIYMDSVFRFSFLAVMLSILLSSSSMESYMVMAYACGSIVQFYIMCSCIQQLLDASREITNKAFNEKWYEYGLPVKRIFMLMTLSNNLECKLSICDMFSLSLPSFMTILNQSYSIALLFLRIK